MLQSFPIIDRSWTRLSPNNKGRNTRIAMATTFLSLLFFFLLFVGCRTFRVSESYDDRSSREAAHHVCKL